MFFSKISLATLLAPPFLKVDYIMASRSNSPYPKTSIVVITTHGSIKTSDAADGTLVPAEFNVKPGINVIKYAEAAAGTCSFANDETMTVFVDYIKHFEHYIENASDINEKKSVVGTIASKFKQRAKKLVKVMQYRNLEKTLEQKDYVHYHNRGNTTRLITEMVDKIYSIGDASVSDTSYDNKIILLNSDMEPDLFAKINQQTGKGYVSLSELIKHLIDNGAEDVVLFDLSCGESDVVHRSERSKRMFNRNLSKSGKLGGDRRMKGSIRRKQSIRRKRTKRRYS